MKNKGNLLAAIFAVVAFVSLAIAASTTFTSLSVTGNTTLSGTTTAATINVTSSQGLRLGTAIVVATSTPSVVGILARTSANELFIATGTTLGAWTKVGGQ